MMPEHLKDITFLPHHIYPGKKNIGSRLSPKYIPWYSLTKEFSIDTIREKNILIEPIKTQMTAIGSDKMGVMVTVRATMPLTDEKKLGYKTSYGIASVTGMKYEGTEESHAQLAYTRAMKTAVEMLLGISDHDVQEVVAEKGLGGKGSCWGIQVTPPSMLLLTPSPGPPGCSTESGAGSRLRTA